MSDASADVSSEGPEPTSTPWRRRRRWPWILLLLLVLGVVGVRAALPLVVERGVAYGSRYWLGLPAHVDNADFALLDGLVVLEGVTVGAAPDAADPMDAALDPPVLDESAALLHFDRVAAHLSWQDLREGRVRVTELSLDSPSVRVQRESDGVIDPLRHAAPLAPPANVEPAPADEPPSEPWPIAVDRFALREPNVQVVDTGSGDELLQFSLETFALESVQVKGSDFALGGVQVEGPKLKIRRDLVLAPPAKAAAAAPVPAPVADPSVEAVPVAAVPSPPAAASATAAPKPARAGSRIDRIDIARATFTWVTDQGPLEVALALKASDITADEGRSFPLDLQLEVASGRIALAGEVGLLPPSYKGKLSWSGLPFPPLLLASLPDLAAWLRSADSQGDLLIDADVAGARGMPQIRMSGRTSIATLAISDPAQKELAVGWKQLEVVMKDVVVPLPEEGKPARTTFANLELVRLVEPMIHYTHPSPALDQLLGIRTAPAASDAAPVPTPAKDAKDSKDARKPAGTPKPVETPVVPAAAAPAVVDVTIAALELTAGDLQVVDTTVTPPVTSFLRGLEVSAADVHIPDPSARAVKIRATLPETSTLEIDGDLRPGNNGDFTVSLQKLDLPTFSPYATAAGATLDGGQVSVKMKLKLRGPAMQVDNDLVLKKFGVSLKDPSSFDRQFGVPIDLALALLRDPSGDIRLKIPVKIGEKGVEVSVAAVIASALKAALLGAVTAPLKMLGAAFEGAQGAAAGGGLFGIAPIPVEPGLADPASAAQGRAADLARLLGSRPSMGLVLKGRTGPAEKTVVAEQILVERLRAGDGLPDLKDSGFLARRRLAQALVARDKAGGAKGTPPSELSKDDAALYGRYVEAVAVPPARLDALCRTRAEKVRDLLVAKGVDASRLTIAEREGDGAPGVVVAFRVR